MITWHEINFLFTSCISRDTIYSNMSSKLKKLARAERDNPTEKLTNQQLVDKYGPAKKPPITYRKWLDALDQRKPRPINQIKREDLIANYQRGKRKSWLERVQANAPKKRSPRENLTQYQERLSKGLRPLLEQDSLEVQKRLKTLEYLKSQLPR